MGELYFAITLLLIFGYAKLIQNFFMEGSGCLSDMGCIGYTVSLVYVFGVFSLVSALINRLFHSMALLPSILLNVIGFVLSCAGAFILSLVFGMFGGGGE